MLQSPFFSIVVCNYNYDSYVGLAIESCLAQDFEDFEIIVVDDGSTDRSRVKIQSYSDPRIKVIYQSNQGQAVAFNVAISAASGKWIAFLDSDDIWYQHKLSFCCRYLFDPKVVALSHSLDMIDSESVTINQRHPGASYCDDALVDYLRLFFYSREFPGGAPTSAMVVRADVLREVYPFSPDWRICADVPLRLCYLFGQLQLCHHVLGGYRIHNSNGYWDKLQDSTNSVKLNRRAYDEIIDFFRRRHVNVFLSYFLSPNCLLEIQVRFGVYARLIYEKFLILLVKLRRYAFYRQLDIWRRSFSPSRA